MNIESEPLLNLDGDLRGLEGNSQDETARNLLDYLKAAYHIRGREFSPEQMRAYLAQTTGVALKDLDSTFPGLADNLDDVFLGIAYADSQLVPGALKQEMNRPIPIYNSQSRLEIIREGGFNRILADFFDFFDAEIMRG